MILRGPMDEHDTNEILSNEDLGESAESLFKHLCDRAGLTANKSNRDRTGWDFIVDFPFRDERSPRTLDQRQKVTCHVQVKATASLGNGSVSLKLSAADLLAKDSRPSLIVVFRLNKEGAAIRGYLVHLLDEPLGKLLRRLRLEESKGQRDIQKRKISFAYRKLGKPFEPTPSGLRAALAEACGPDPAGYALEKVRQLSELGYENGELEVEGVFHVGDDEQFARVLLGLEPMRPVAIEAFDVRFGIAVPYRGELFNTIQEIFVLPPAVTDCTIVVKGPPLMPAATLEAQLVVASPIDSRFRMLIQHPHFEFTFRETDEMIVASCTFEPGNASLSDLKMLLRALNYIAAGNASMSAAGKFGAWGPLQLPIASEITGPGLSEMPRLARFVACWQKLLDIAGVPSTALIPWNDLWNEKAHLAVSLMLSEEPMPFYEFDRDVLPVDGEPIEAIHFNSASIAGEAILYAVAMTLAPRAENPDVYRSVSFRPIEARPATMELDDYMDELASRFKPAVMIHPDNVRRIAREEFERKI